MNREGELPRVGNPPTLELNLEDADFPRDLVAEGTVNLQRLRERRERENARLQSRANRKERAQYVLPFRLLCYLTFAIVLLVKLNKDITSGGSSSFSWALVFIPLWIEQVDKILNNGENVYQAIKEGIFDREKRYDMLLPPIAKIIIDVGSIITKIVLAIRIDMNPLPFHSISFAPSPASSLNATSNNTGFPSHSTSIYNNPLYYNNSNISSLPSTVPNSNNALPSYRQVFLPFWIAVGVSTFVICWTPDRPEVRNPNDTNCQKFWRQVTTGAIYGGTALLLPLLIVNKVDEVSSNTSWTMVFLPIWAVLVLAGVIGFIVLPIYSVCVLSDSLPTTAHHIRSERQSVARLLFAFAYSTSATVLSLSFFLYNLTLRLESENQEFWNQNARASSSSSSTLHNISLSNATLLSLAPSSFSLNASSSSSLLAPRVAPSSSGTVAGPIPKVTNEQICWPLILGFSNLFVCVCYIRFVMIKHRVTNRQRAREEFEAAAFDTQQGGVRYSSSSSAQFEPIPNPIVLVGSESNLIFKVWNAALVHVDEEKLTIGLYHEAMAAGTTTRDGKKEKRNEEERKEKEPSTIEEKSGGSSTKIDGNTNDCTVVNVADKGAGGGAGVVVVSRTKIVHKSNGQGVDEQTKDREERKEEKENNATIDAIDATEDNEEFKETQQDQQESKNESKDESKNDTPYFFEMGTDKTCFICADLPPSKCLF
jgi:hypothetical protein